MVKDGDCRGDEAFLNDDTMAEDHGVKDATKGTEHHILKLLLDTLRLPHVHCFDKEDVIVQSLLMELRDFGVDVILITNEKHELSQVALEELLGYGRSDSARGTCEKNTLTLKFLFEIK